MCPIDTTMTNDPQCRREKRCCRCGGCIYHPPITVSAVKGGTYALGRIEPVL